MVAGVEQGGQVRAMAMEGRCCLQICDARLSLPAGRQMSEPSHAPASAWLVAPSRAMTAVRRRARCCGRCATAGSAPGGWVGR